VMGFFEIEFWELFSQGGFELQPSCSLPPKTLNYRCEPPVPGSFYVSECWFSFLI
jgi:hypothetical protein